MGREVIGFDRHWGGTIGHEDRYYRRTRMMTYDEAVALHRAETAAAVKEFAEEVAQMIDEMRIPSYMAGLPDLVRKMAAAR